MDRQRLENQLVIDEGKRLTAYRDSVNLLTIGIGHLILPSDNIPEGSTISEERCDQLFQDDLNHAIAHTEIIFPDLMSYPEAIQESLTNMVFNLGANGLAGKFPRFCAAIKAGDYAEAVRQLENTVWHRQVGARADRIIAAIAGCADTATT